MNSLRDRVRLNKTQFACSQVWHFPTGVSPELGILRSILSDKSTKFLLYGIRSLMLAKNALVQVVSWPMAIYLIMVQSYDSFGKKITYDSFKVTSRATTQ